MRKKVNIFVVYINNGKYNNKKNILSYLPTRIKNWTDVKCESWESVVLLHTGCYYSSLINTAGVWHNAHFFKGWLFIFPFFNKKKIFYRKSWYLTSYSVLKCYFFIDYWTGNHFKLLGRYRIIIFLKCLKTFHPSLDALMKKGTCGHKFCSFLYFLKSCPEQTTWTLT